MTPLDRREFIGLAAHTAGATLAGFAALDAWSCQGPPAGRRRPAGLGEGGYGPLERAGPDLALPRGFEYRRFGLAGQPMSDGSPTPAAHDGMAAFPLPNGNIRLIRNHELSLSGSRRRRAPEPAYDPRAAGGTTSLEIDPSTLEVVADFRSLNGTARNCAGGPTPWGSWLTCEESVVGPGSGAERAHGYIFEVPASATAAVTPVPLRAMGHFVHEAVAVDPTTGIVYETEDQNRGGFYRYVPARPFTDGRPADLAAGGRLQMLAIRDRPQYDCARGQVTGRSLPVSWVDIPYPDPADAESDPAAVFDQGWRQGAARFSRVEGCWYGDGAICFSCTNGGNARRGQVWRYRPAPDGGELTLIFESPSKQVLDHPDNVCVSPRGGIVLCEDGEGHPYIRGLTPDGRIFDLARNLGSRSEFAGATFSPDGETLFFNIQRDPGATFALRGPWAQGSL
jgi:secreted PhoX family phosphatase